MFKNFFSRILNIFHANFGKLPKNHLNRWILKVGYSPSWGVCSHEVEIGDKLGVCGTLRVLRGDWIGAFASIATFFHLQKEIYFALHLRYSGKVQNWVSIRFAKPITRWILTREVITIIIQYRVILKTLIFNWSSAYNLSSKQAEGHKFDSP